MWYGLDIVPLSDNFGQHLKSQKNEKLKIAFSILHIPHGQRLLYGWLQ
jgi:hypothetical protein